jgi:RNase P subunit RPR2
MVNGFMKKKLTKKQAKQKIDNFFNNIHKIKPEAKEIKKIKRLAMKHNIKLKNKRRLFCKKCYAIFPENAQIKINDNKKIIKCLGCGAVFRWKIK